MYRKVKGLRTFLIIIMALLFISIPVYVFIRMIHSFMINVRTQNTKDSPIFRAIDVYYSIGIYCLLLFGFYLNGSAIKGGERLRIFELTEMKANGYASLANEHIMTVIVLLTFGLFSHLIIRFKSDELSPIIYVGSTTMVILNVIFSGFYLTHTGFPHDGEQFSVWFLQAGFLSLLFLYIAGLKVSLNLYLENQHGKGIVDNNKFLLFLYRVSDGYRKVPRLWAISFFPILVIIQLILVLFGQPLDSFIRVFLDTSSFNYSNIPAPKPEIVEGDGHYLCTVSAKGHKRLVKPIRAGIRGGLRIPVNRQLLIANAFENILEQYMPNCHKAIRAFYDRYGYPLSRHIQDERISRCCLPCDETSGMVFLICVVHG